MKRRSASVFCADKGRPESMSITRDVSGGTEEVPAWRGGFVDDVQPSPSLDVETFARLYEQHRDVLYRFCRRRAHDRTLVDDIVQDVFEKAFAYRSTFDPRRRFWPWLASIAARACIDAHRRAASAEARHDQYGRHTYREPFDVTSTTVLDAIDQRSFGRHVAALPARQRAVLCLFLDGWSYDDIAGQFGYSATAVKALLRRARATLREATGRWIGVGVGLARTARARVQQLAARVQAVVWPSVDGLGLSTANLSASISAAVVVIVVASGALAPVGSTMPSPTTLVSTGTFALPDSDSGSADGTGGRAVGPKPIRRAVSPPTGDAERVGNELTASLLPGSAGGDSPDSMHAASFAQSPSDDDPTLFVAGRIGFHPADDASGAAVPLLVSHDDASSWQRRRAAGLAPVTRLVLPPAYPRDNRLFALTAKGLQVSHDDGDSFVTLLPGVQMDDLLLPPEFGTDDSTLFFLAQQRLWWSPTELGPATPVHLEGPLATHLVAGVTFMPGQDDGRSLIVGSRLPNALAGDSGHYVSRCLPPVVTAALPVPRLDCESVKLPHSPTGTLPLRQSPRFRPGLLFVPFPHAPLVSADGGRTFGPARPASFDVDVYSPIGDLAAAPSPSGESAVVVQNVAGTYLPRSQLARTDDGGRNWTPIVVDLPNFYWADKVTVTPSGRIVASSQSGGLACSADDGRTWGRTCPSPAA
jgi:RNA polymerase sigma-70 factor (ECF subfamily)